MSMRTLEDLCAGSCAIPLLAKMEAMCFDCAALSCDHSCAYDGASHPKPVKREQPPCEDWQCKHRPKCERAFEAGRIARESCAGCVWEFADFDNADACNDCIRKLALPDNYVPAEERSYP